MAAILPPRASGAELALGQYSLSHRSSTGTRAKGAPAAGADYFVNVLPGGPRNANLVGRDVIDALKPTAYFINVGRGEIVDEAALIAALREGRIAGAGLDVFSVEPLPEESPL